MSWLRKLLLSLVVANLLFFGGRWAYRALAADETKIRWRVEELVDGFNDRKTGDVLDVLARDFRDRVSGATRADVHAGLVQLFFEQVDGRTHAFLMRAELVPDELTIEIDPTDARHADVALRVLVYERAGEAEKLFWDARVAGRWEKGEDGWQCTTTTEVNHRERSRWR